MIKKYLFTVVFVFISALSFAQGVTASCGLIFPEKSCKDSFLLEKKTVKVLHGNEKSFRFEVILEVNNITASPAERTKIKIIDYGLQYEYGTGLVFTGRKYDHIVGKNTYNKKYIEVLPDRINIYEAYAPDGNYDAGWEADAAYKMENTFLF